MSKRKVYNPKPRVSLAGKEHIDIWNELYCSVDSSSTNDVLTSEEFYIIDDFKLLKSDAKILEAGCGDGRWIKALHNLWKNVIC